MKALILDGQSRAAIESTQSLGRAGVTVAVSAGQPGAIAFRSRYAAIKLQQPPVIPGDQFLEWLADVDSQHGFDLIVASTESSLLAMMQLPEQSSMRRRAVLPPQASLEIALDKNRTLEVAAELGVPLPGTRLLTRVDEIGLPAVYPTVLKPVRSKVVSGGGIRSLEPAIVNGAAARRAALEKWLPAVPVLEQEYVQGWGAGIEVLYENGELVWYLAHERLHEWPMTGGASTYRRAIEPDPQMLDAAKRLFDELKWHGVGMAEFKRRKDGSFALMEINPRLWGSLALSIDAGVDFPLGLLRIATGALPGPQPNYRRGMRTRHLSRDLRWLKCNAVADRSDSLLLLRPKLKSILELGLFIGGREHWDHFRWTDPKPFLHDTFRMVHESLDSLRNRARTRSMLRHRTGIVNQAVERAVKTGTPRFLFVCQGNICRSPFAELAARRHFANCEVESAGLDPRAGRSTPTELAAEAASMGFDMSNCRSTPVAAERVRSADLIFVMDLANYDGLRERFPECREKAVLLGLFGKKPAVVVEDPDGKDEATIARVLRQILSAIEGFAAAMSARSPAQHRVTNPETPALTK